MRGEEADKSLTKMEITEHFSKLFEDEDNSCCFNCGKKSRQWAEIKHGIFLCLSCAANFKEYGRVVSVKSISLDLWNDQELRILQRGGNRRFKEFLKKFGFETTDPKVILKTKAVEYYRQLIVCEALQTPTPIEPSLQEGTQPMPHEIPLSDMTGDEIIREAKERLTWAGERSKHYGKKAYDKVHHKITSGELKEDVQKAGQKVSETAKSVWAFVSAKIDELKKENREQKKEEEPREM